MSAKIHLLDTNTFNKDAAESIVLNEIRSIIASGDSGCLEHENTSVLFSDEVVTSLGDAVDVIKTMEQDRVILIPFERSDFNDEKLAVIGGIGEKFDQRISKSTKMLQKCTQDVSDVKSKLLQDVKNSTRAKVLCKHCKSLMPTNLIESLECPVCKTEYAFIGDYKINFIDIRVKKMNKAKGDLRKLRLERDGKIEDAIKTSESFKKTWVAGIRYDDSMQG